MKCLAPTFKVITGKPDFKHFHLVISFFIKALPAKDVKEKPEEIRTREADKLPNSVEPRHQPSALFAAENSKAIKSPQRSSSKIKENKHPFALYGWGEKQTNTGSQKTHNVCASAPVREVGARCLAFPLSLGGWELGCVAVTGYLILWSLWCFGVVRDCRDHRGSETSQNWASDQQMGGFW